MPLYIPAPSTDINLKNLITVPYFSVTPFYTGHAAGAYLYFGATNGGVYITSAGKSIEACAAQPGGGGSIIRAMGNWEDRIYVWHGPSGGATMSYSDDQGASWTDTVFGAGDPQTMAIKQSTGQVVCSSGNGNIFASNDGSVFSFAGNSGTLSSGQVGQQSVFYDAVSDRFFIGHSGGYAYVSATSDITNFANYTSVVIAGTYFQGFARINGIFLAAVQNASGATLYESTDNGDSFNQSTNPLFCEGAASATNYSFRVIENNLYWFGYQGRAGYTSDGVNWVVLNNSYATTIVRSAYFNGTIYGLTNNTSIVKSLTT